MPIAEGMYYSKYTGAHTNRTPIVLLHGAGGTNLHWPPEIRRLSGFDVYALDLPGHGKSSGPGEQSIHAYAEKVVALCRIIGIRRAVFIGHSMGGAIAMTLGLEHPEMVRALGLIGTGARLRVHPDIMEGTTSEATYSGVIETILSWSFSEYAEVRLVELAGKRMQETRLSVLHSDFLACNNFDIMDQAEKLRFPTLVLCGAEDMLTPVRYSQYLAGKIPSARLTVIPEAGHMVMLEKPQAVTDSLRNFLDRMRL